MAGRLFQVYRRASPEQLRKAREVLGLHLRGKRVRCLAAGEMIDLSGCQLAPADVEALSRAGRFVR